MPPPGLIVVASDPITRDGVCSWFRSSGLVRLLPPDAAADADVTVLFAHQVAEDTLATMRQLVKQAAQPAMKFVLVADHIREVELIRAVRYGLVGLVPRSQGCMDQVLQAVLRSWEGGVQLPDVLVKSLIDQVRTLRDGLQESQGPEMAGLTEREVEVLKLFAEGFDTAKAADALNCSEYTIKHILSGMMVRLGLRNRAHAIAYAMRSGAF